MTNYLFQFINKETKIKSTDVDLAFNRSLLTTFIFPERFKKRKTKKKKNLLVYLLQKQKKLI